MVLDLEEIEDAGDTLSARNRIREDDGRLAGFALQIVV